MAFLDEITQGQGGLSTRSSVRPILTLVSDSGIEPISVQEMKVGMKYPVGQTHEDDDLLAILQAVRAEVQNYTAQVWGCETWKQTQNIVSRIYRLYRRPVLSISSIQYISGWDADTLLTVDSGSYTLAGEYAAARSSWPSHRGFASWVTTYKAGVYNVTSPTDPAQIAALRAAVPPEVKRGIIQWAGHFYENREGQGPISKYEVAQKIAGNMPPNVASLLERHIMRRISAL
jgi:hypothetical protein